MDKEKTVTLVFKNCKGCPHLSYEEYNDVGTSFGLDYYCKLDRDICMTSVEASKKINDKCPLP